MRSLPSFPAISVIAAAAPRWLAVFATALIVSSSIAYLFLQTDRPSSAEAVKSAVAAEESVREGEAALEAPAAQEEAPQPEMPEEADGIAIEGFWMPHLISWADGTSATKQDIDLRYCMRLFNYIEVYRDGGGWVCLDSLKEYAEVSETGDLEWPFAITSAYGAFKARLDGSDGDVLVVQLDGAGVMYLSPAARPDNLDRFVE